MNLIRHVSLAIIAVLATSYLPACHSSDLGSEKPVQIPVDLALAGWDSGAGQVIATKCANCHTAKRSSFVPSNTPRILDGIESIEFFKNPENKGLAKAMRRRIESTDSKKQMPPQFATPLLENEKAVVIEFLKSVEEGSTQEAEANPTPPNGDCIKTLSSFSISRHGDDDDDDGDDDDGDDDDDDHGGHHQPRPTPTPTPSSTVTPTPGNPAPTNAPEPCKNPSPGPQPTPNPGTTTVTFAEIQPMVQATCAKSGCHTGASGDQFRLTAKEDFVAVRALALSELKSGSMPRRNPGWKDTPDGKKLILWLSGDMP